MIWLMICLYSNYLDQAQIPTQSSFITLPDEGSLEYGYFPKVLFEMLDFKGINLQS